MSHNLLFKAVDSLSSVLTILVDVTHSISGIQTSPASCAEIFKHRNAELCEIRLATTTSLHFTFTFVSSFVEIARRGIDFKTFGQHFNRILGSLAARSVVYWPGMESRTVKDFLGKSRYGIIWIEFKLIYHKVVQRHALFVVESLFIAFLPLFCLFGEDMVLSKVAVWCGG